jgi:hypothetical protein
VDHRAVAPLPLGLVERSIGRAEQRAGGRTVLREGGDTEAHRERHGLAAELRAHLGAQPLGDGLGVGGRCRRQQQRELLAADPRNGVDRPRPAVEQARDAAEGLVAGGVSAAIIDLLEVVEVADHDRQRRGRTLRAGELELEHLAEGAPVEQAGQGITLRLLLEPADERRDAGPGDQHQRGACRQGADRYQPPQHVILDRDERIGDGDGPKLEERRSPGEEVEGVERDPDVEKPIRARARAGEVDGERDEHRAHGERQLQCGGRHPATAGCQCPGDQISAEDQAQDPELVHLRGMRKQEAKQPE